MAEESYNERYVAALKRERAGYVACGLTDRVQQVDKQLAAFGAKADEIAELAVDDKPKGRRSRPAETGR